VFGVSISVAGSSNIGLRNCPLANIVTLAHEGPTLRKSQKCTHLQQHVLILELPIKPRNLRFLEKIEKNHLQEFPIPPLNLLALGKNHLMRGYMRASSLRISISQSKVEERGKE